MIHRQSAGGSVARGVQFNIECTGCQSRCCLSLRFRGRCRRCSLSFSISLFVVAQYVSYRAYAMPRLFCLLSGSRAKCSHLTLSVFTTFVVIFYSARLLFSKTETVRW